MYTYLEKFNSLIRNQFGFRQNCAASQAVRQLYDDFLANLDQKKDLLLSVYRPEQGI